MLTRRRFVEVGSLSFLASWGSEGFALPSRHTLPGLRRTTLRLPQLPEAWDGLRILQVSDVHAGPYMPVARMRRIRDMILSIPADLIVFTGDQLDRRASDAERFERGFGGLDAPLGVYGILGNHDHGVGPRLAEQALAAAGISPLVNRSVLLTRGRSRLALAGVEDLLAEAPRSPDFSILEHHRSAFRICLCHQPQGWHEALAAGAHLTLAGHTHGGQIAITARNLNMARLRTRYVAGPYRREDAFLHVSRGIGVGAVPLRMGAPPEIDLLTLRRPSPEAGVAA